MTRWFMLTQSTTYAWKSKRSGRSYQFVAQKTVAIDNVRDQDHFLNNTERFVEVDVRGNPIDRDTGQRMSRTAFSRKGMIKKPRTYSKLTKQSMPAPAPAPVPEPPKPAAP